MARIKIELPDDFIFQTEISVRISDINYGGHLGNDALLSLIHEARVRFLDQAGYGELNIEGLGIILADVGICYKAESFFGDKLIIELAATDFSRKGCDLLYRLTEKTSGKEIARAKTGIVFFDYAKRQTACIPAVFYALFNLEAAQPT